MKKKIILLSFLSSILIMSCSSDGSKSTQDTAYNSNKSMDSNADQSVNNEGLRGKELIQKLDCIGCHNAQNKIVGPSYAEIAAKYDHKDIDYLASKVIEGGKGVWGDIPMNAHPTLSKEDAKDIIKYILTIK